MKILGISGPQTNNKSLHECARRSGGIGLGLPAKMSSFKTSTIRAIGAANNDYILISGIVSKS